MEGVKRNRSYGDISGSALLALPLAPPLALSFSLPLAFPLALPFALSFSFPLAFLFAFLQGFVLFLAIPIEWSRPFGGLPIFGAVAALALWLYALHQLVLLGYRLLLALDR